LIDHLEWDNKRSYSKNRELWSVIEFVKKLKNIGAIELVPEKITDKQREKLDFYLNDRRIGIKFEEIM